MLGLFKELTGFLKLEKVSTDNKTFRLFYKGSLWLHFGIIILIGAKQYFGDPINCHQRKSDIEQNMFATYCWIHGTYTREEYLGELFFQKKISNFFFIQNSVRTSRFFHEPSSS